MPISQLLSTYIAREFIVANNLQQSCETELVALAPSLSEDADANKAVLDEWLSTRLHLRRAQENKIDLSLERTAFGQEATPAGRAKAFRNYGEGLFNERMKAWGAEPGIIRSGSEPNVQKADAAIASQARSIVEEQYANCPLNPRKVYMTEATRLNDIARYILRFGSKQASKAAAHFNVDWAGRSLERKRT